MLFQMSRKNRGSAGGYFLAGRNMNWIPVSKISGYLTLGIYWKPLNRFFSKQ